MFIDWFLQAIHQFLMFGLSLLPLWAFDFIMPEWMDTGLAIIFYYFNMSPFMIVLALAIGSFFAFALFKFIMFIWKYAVPV